MSGKKTISQWKLVASSSWLAGQEFPLYQEGTVLGRGKSCDITIPGTHLSRNHAEITFKNGDIVVKDLASSNGTFVNNTKVSETPLADGDVLRLDVYSFTVAGPKKNSSVQTETTVTEPRASVNSSAAKSLETIRSMKTQEKDYSQTQWVTKPTSVGNRSHNVPSHHHRPVDAGFWLALILGLGIVGGLLYYLIS